MHLTVFVDRLQPVILIDLSVDGDGDALFKMRLKLWMLFAKDTEQSTHVVNVQIEFPRPFDELLQVSVQDHSGQGNAPMRWLSSRVHGAARG
jgi:hypothetical protein